MIITKEEIIDDISSLYPIDCQYDDTNRIGKRLLLEAFENVNFNWRDLPYEILYEYRRLCIIKENEN